MAQANCTAAQRFGFEFSTAPAQAMSYTQSYNFTATDGFGGSVPFTVSFFTNGVNSTNVGGQTLPRISTLINDGNPTTASNLVIGMVLTGRTADINSNTRVVRTTFTFGTPIRDLTIQVNDIDFNSNQYRDWLLIRGSNGAATYAPVLTTPFGTNNGAGPRSGGGSGVVLGNATTPLTVATTSEMLGNGSSNNADTIGTITASFAEPVTSVTLTYGNSNQAAGGGTTGQQGYGIQFLRFCALPQPQLAKTSSRVDSSGVNRFSVPGADRLYTISFTNAGGSSIDLAGAAIEDAMPAEIDFRNIDYAGGSGSPFEVTASGGATIAAPIASYSNSTTGTNFSYVPVPGYDGNVRRFRITGTGSIPVGGTVTVRFRARVD